MIKNNQIGFFFDQSRCTGCYTCVAACRQWHSVIEVSISRRKVETIEKGKFPNINVFFLSLSCLHCRNPACVSVCPMGAIFKRKEDGVVCVNSEECIGGKNCGLCKEACPYSIPQFNPQNDYKMEKCNICLDRLEGGVDPICVAACPSHALKVGPLSELKEKYGDGKEAEGFMYSQDNEPSIVIKNRKIEI